MKFLITIILSFGLVLPNLSYALSCVPPTEMLNSYIDSDNYTILLASPTEFQGEEPSQTSGLLPVPSTQSYVGQKLSVKKIYKGNLEDNAFVWFMNDSTWGYGCTNTPPELGSENIYVLYTTDDRSIVSNVFASTSEQGRSLLEKASQNEVVTDREKMSQLAAEIRELIVEIRIKLAEFRSIQSRIN